MLRIIGGVLAAVAAILYINHQNRGPSPIKLSGTVECASGEIDFTKGPLKGRTFPNVSSAMTALRGAGYSGKGLEQLPKILEAACDGQLWDHDESRIDSARTNFVPARYSKSASAAASSIDYSILKLVKNSTGFTFDLLNVDLGKHGGSLPAYVERQGKGKSRNCKQTSYDPPANCYKCENPLEVWCTTGQILR